MQRQPPLPTENLRPHPLTPTPSPTLTPPSSHRRPPILSDRHQPRVQIHLHPLPRHLRPTRLPPPSNVLSHTRRQPKRGRRRRRRRWPHPMREMLELDHLHQHLLDVRRGRGARRGAGGVRVVFLALGLFCMLVVRRRFFPLFFPFCFCFSFLFRSAGLGGESGKSEKGGTACVGGVEKDWELTRVGCNWQVPMKPPPWTDDERGIDLLAPPVCRRCRFLPATSFVPSSGGAGVDGRWMDSVVAGREDDDGGGDDDGVEEMARAQTAVEEDSRSLINKGSGSLRRITEVGEEAEYEMREESSVSGTVKRKRSGSRARPLRVGKKRREEDDIRDVLWAGDDVQHETRLPTEEASEDTERYIAADTIDTAGPEPELPANKTAEDPAPAVTPTTYGPVLGPTDETHAHTRSVDGPLPADRTSPVPTRRPEQTPSPKPPTDRPPPPTPPSSAPHNDPNQTPIPTSPSPPSSSLLTKLTTLLTTHLLRKPSPQPPPPTPRCAGCHLPLLRAPSSTSSPSHSTTFPSQSTSTSTSPSPSARGPFNTLYHAHCMRCASCDRVLQGGTSWFERDGEGAVEVSCRRCWRERRFAAGWGADEVDEGEMGLGFVW